MQTTKATLNRDPFEARHGDAIADWDGKWPARWISVESENAEPLVAAYKLEFNLQSERTVRIHVTADQRYELYGDGALIGRGSERGDVNNWFFETYDIAIGAGSHMFVARVWSLPFEMTPYAQFALGHGFLLAPDDPALENTLATGTAPWEGKRLNGIAFTNPMCAWGTGWNVSVDGASFDWGFESGMGDGWASVVSGDAGCDGKRLNDVRPTHFMRPAMLPEAFSAPVVGTSVRHVSAIESLTTHDVPIRAADNLQPECDSWHKLLSGSPLTVPANTRRRVLIDLNDYYCAYPELVASGGEGATVRINWQECLFENANATDKGNRNEIEGKYFVTLWWVKDGVGDTFKIGGRPSQQSYRTLWWQCGRYVEVVVETGNEPLTISGLCFYETRYPMAMSGRFDSSNPVVPAIIPIAQRGLQMCSHETFFDCPYYEQLMYIGDARVEALITYVCTSDDRLVRKALMMFDASRQINGLTESRYPSPVKQMSPTFSLWYACMVRDYLYWRGDPSFVRRLMPGVRGIVDQFLAQGDSRGLIVAPIGGNFVDWAKGWRGGSPKDANEGVSSIIQLQLVVALAQIADVEEALGETELAARLRRRHAELSSLVNRWFWDQERGIYADDLEKTTWSQHAQILALLSGAVPAERLPRVVRSLVESADLTKPTIYFKHYLFEAYQKFGMRGRLYADLDMWSQLVKDGYKTTPEWTDEPIRSDCHGWSAHPLFHAYATILGIRPSAPGFKSVRIEPMITPGQTDSGTMPHPAGDLSVSFVCSDSVVDAKVDLPPGVSGMLVLHGRDYPLTEGTNTVHHTAGLA